MSYTRQQIDACIRNGLRIAGYVWCFPGDTASSMHSRLKMFDGFALESLWLDVEQSHVKVADVDSDLAVCDAYSGHLTGIYSGHWYFQQQGWLGVTKWADQGRPLWDSRYDGVPVTQAGFVAYGGWHSCLIKQYAGTSTVGSVSQIDLDVTG